MEVGQSYCQTESSDGLWGVALSPNGPSRTIFKPGHARPTAYRQQARIWIRLLLLTSRRQDPRDPILTFLDAYSWQMSGSAGSSVAQSEFRGCGARSELVRSRNEFCFWKFLSSFPYSLHSWLGWVGASQPPSPMSSDGGNRRKRNLPIPGPWHAAR